MSKPPPAYPTLRDKIAIVTGGSRGIGYQIAYELARRGACVLITYTSASSKEIVEALVEKMEQADPEVRCVSYRADLRDPAAPEAITKATTSFFGEHPIDILVNNAGCELGRPVADITAADFAYVYDLNVRAVALMTAAVVPHLPADGGGRIINIGSVGGRSGLKDLSLYCSSKAAVEGLTRCHAAELGAKGHSVNCVCPGPVPTDMLEGISKEIVEQQMKNTPMENRLGSTDDIAQIVGFLAEDGSRWITGQTISATGGNYML